MNIFSNEIMMIIGFPEFKKGVFMNIALVTAGGVGSRVGHEIPKQFLYLFSLLLLHNSFFSFLKQIFYPHFPFK